MGGLIIFLLLCLGIAAVPIFLIFTVSRLTEADRSSHLAPEPPIVTSLLQAEAPRNETLFTGPQSDSNDRVKPQKKSGTGSFVWFLLIALSVPFVGLVILGMGEGSLAFAMMMSIAAFGYGGFFDFAIASVNLGLGILKLGLWGFLISCAVFLLVKLIKALE